MRAYVSHEKKIVVLWSPKCACTSVVDWFYTGVLQLDKKISKRVFLTENHLATAHQAKLYCENDGYKSVAVVRNPTSRSSSAYLNKFLYRNGKPISGYDGLETLSQTLYTQFKEYDNIETEEYVGLSFYDYLRFIKHIQKTHKKINDHWNIQFSENMEFDFLVKVEDFNTQLASVNDKLGISDYIPRRLNSTGNPGLDDLGEHEVVDKTSSVKLLNDNLFVTKRNILSEDCMELIKQIYSIDFEKFGY